MKSSAVLFFSLLTVLAVAAPKTQDNHPSAGALQPGQIILTVVQSSPPSAKKGVKLNALTVTVNRQGECTDGKVTLKAYFMGKDVGTNKLVVNSVNEQAVATQVGSGGAFTFTSNPFEYTAEIPALKKTKAVPAHGVQPHGWVVRVYQHDQLLASASSGQGYDTVIAMNTK